MRTLAMTSLCFMIVAAFSLMDLANLKFAAGLIVIAWAVAFVGLMQANDERD